MQQFSQTIISDINIYTQSTFISIVITFFSYFQWLIFRNWIIRFNLQKKTLHHKLFISHSPINLPSPPTRHQFGPTQTTNPTLIHKGTLKKLNLQIKHILSKILSHSTIMCTKPPPPILGHLSRIRTNSNDSPNPYI